MNSLNEQDSETQERILTFMESMAPKNTPFLDRLEEEALEDAVPVIRPQTQSLIRFLMELLEPEQILEIGTGTGFSSCLMLTYAPADCRVTTIEKDPERIRKAGLNFRRMSETPDGLLQPEENPADKDWTDPVGSNDSAGGNDKDKFCRISLLEGDAADILPTLTSGQYDFIFMDAAKGQYIHFLPEVLRVLAPHGVLLSDNIFKGGEILESRFAVKRRDRTIHKRMREYLYSLTHDPDLQTLLLQEGDGAALTLKRRPVMPL